MYAQQLDSARTSFKNAASVIVREQTCVKFINDARQIRLHGDGQGCQASRILRPELYILLHVSKQIGAHPGIVRHRGSVKRARMTRRLRESPKRV
jgi:hypothetical protein